MNVKFDPVFLPQIDHFWNTQYSHDKRLLFSLHVEVSDNFHDTENQHFPLNGSVSLKAQQNGRVFNTRLKTWNVCGTMNGFTTIFYWQSFKFITSSWYINLSAKQRWNTINYSSISQFPSLCFSLLPPSSLFICFN